MSDNLQLSSMMSVSKSTGIDRNVRINHPFYSHENLSYKNSCSIVSLQSQNLRANPKLNHSVQAGLFNHTHTDLRGSQNWREMKCDRKRLFAETHQVIPSTSNQKNLIGSTRQLRQNSSPANSRSPDSSNSWSLDQTKIAEKLTG